MSEDPIPLIGYTEKFSATPGETLSFQVSSHSASDYRAQLVRVISCDPNPEGPGIIEHLLDSPINGVYPSRVQPVNLGSYVQVKDASALDEQLCSIMNSIHERCVIEGKREDGYVDYMKGANIAAFRRLADAMLAQGV